jgi:hypothetical protein
MTAAGNVDGWLAFPTHGPTCPVCRGSNVVGVSLVRRRLADWVEVVDPMSSIEDCPLISPLSGLVGRAPGPRPPGGVA